MYFNGKYNIIFHTVPVWFTSLNHALDLETDWSIDMQIMVIKGHTCPFQTTTEYQQLLLKQGTNVILVVRFTLPDFSKKESVKIAISLIPKNVTIFIDQIHTWKKVLVPFYYNPLCLSKFCKCHTIPKIQRQILQFPCKDFIIDVTLN